MWTVPSSKFTKLTTWKNCLEITHSKSEDKQNNFHFSSPATLMACGKQGTKTHWFHQNFTKYITNRQVKMNKVWLIPICTSNMDFLLLCSSITLTPHSNSCSPLGTFTLSCFRRPTWNSGCSSLLVLGVRTLSVVASRFPCSQTIALHTKNKQLVVINWQIHTWIHTRRKKNLKTIDCHAYTFCNTI